jgi:hypothetical protein
VSGAIWQSWPPICFDGGVRGGPHHSAHPSWLKRADEALARASKCVAILAATAPLNLSAEIERLASRWSKGQPQRSRFSYAARPEEWSDWERALYGLADGLPDDEPLGELYAARARELALEASICGAVATPRLWRLARQRFHASGPDRREADALVDAWLAASDDPGPEGGLRTDDEGHPDSLFCRMRKAVAARRLPFRVEVSPHLSALAATGDGVVLIAKGRFASAEDVERTVLHEIEGHVMPRIHAAEQRLGILRFGTAGASDDQEGRALSIEDRSGLLSADRRRELALRHAACALVEARADFVETARALIAHGASIERALRIASRAHRGGGLGREIVYLPALCRVRSHEREDPAAVELMSRGQVSLGSAGRLREILT